MISLLEIPDLYFDDESLSDENVRFSEKNLSSALMLAINHYKRVIDGMKNDGVLDEHIHFLQQQVDEWEILYFVVTSYDFTVNWRSN